MDVAITVVILLAIIAALVFGSAGPDAVLLGGLVAMVVVGVVEPKAAIAGFSNEGMLTVGALFLVAAGVRQTGAMARIATPLLGRSTNPRVALARLTLPIAAMSAFLNNTPIVAALLPAVTEWARKNQQPASRFLIPLSYATILGGTMTLIGTSTNLVVTGLIEKNLGKVPGLHPLGIFDITPIGLTLTVVGCAMLIGLGPWLLPDRRPAVSSTDDPRMYTSEFLVLAGSALVGSTIEDAGLRHLPGAFLAEIDRGRMVLPAVEPTTRLEAHDRLVFVGPRESVVDLGRIPGLAAAPTQTFLAGETPTDRCLVEAVVAPANPVVGRSIREGEFRATFQAVVVAVARDGERVAGRIGDIVLQAGDVLLLEAGPSWVEAQRGRRDFYLVSEVADSASFRHERAWVALTIVAVMVLAAATGFASMFIASMAAVVAMLATGCLTGPEARRNVEWSVLIAIAAAFGIGEGIRESGTDAAFAQAVLSLGADTPWTALIALYIATAILTETVTNNAAAALMFPFGLSLAAGFDVSPMPYCVAVMFAASASFMTPIGYQTNLMVYGPGGYKFTDFTRIGVPFQLTCAVVSCTLIPRFFPF